MDQSLVQLNAHFIKALQRCCARRVPASVIIEACWNPNLVKENAMATTRREVLVAAVAGGLSVTGAARAEEKRLAPDQPARLADGERRRLEEGGPAIVKMFIAALRKRYTDEQAAELRQFIDPRYLKEHGLQDGAFPIQRVVTGRIHRNDLSDDPRTALIIAKTDDAAKECFLFRLTVHQRNVYLLPLAPPDTKSTSFKPWILRVKV